MGNNNLKDTNNILVKVDQNNLIYIDPNTIVADGRPQPRDIDPENLTLYVNLEADLIPRTTLISSGDQSSLTSIAGGNLNFLKNQNGRDYDTTWTDAYTEISKNPLELTSTNGRGNDNSAQSFGIDSISIKIEGVNYIPQVQIRFIDVRGKTLFESPEDSPYGAFFHLPWPIFYLTVKGFYGKAVRFRLHMVKFNTRFNPDNGNMEVDTTFVGSTYAYLADISYEAVLNAPYFYLSESNLDGKLNEETGKKEVSVSKTTKGYRILKSVYQEYKAKGLLPNDFPIRTLREIIIIAGRLSKTLEQEIFDKVIDPKILAAVKEFDDLMSTFGDGVLAWKKINLSAEYFVNGQRRSGTKEEIRWFKLTGDDRNTLNKIVNPRNEGTLERLIYNASEKAAYNVAFGKNRNNSLIKKEKLTISPISFVPLKNIKDFYTQDGPTVGVDMDGVQDAIYTIYRNFIEQRNKLESDIEEHMNEIVKDKTKGIGFEPTIRNIIGVVLANADTYIRLMKDVHTKAFENGEIRRKILAGFDTDSDVRDQCIYPWPEVRVKTAGDRELVLKYPGARELLVKLQSNNKDLWPEVEFVENFYEIATKKLDPLTGKEGGADNIEFIFQSEGSSEKIDISVLTNLMGNLPYDNKSFSSVLYEIFERARYTTSFNPFSNEVMVELANAEFENLKSQLSEDIDLIDLLKINITNPNNLLSFMQATSAFERFPYYQDQLPTTWYLKEGLSQDFRVTKYVKNSQITNNNDNRFLKLSNFLKKYQPEAYRTTIYPFNSTTYSEYLGHDFSDRDLSLGQMLEVNTPNDFITSQVDPKMWVKDGYDTNMFTNTLDFNGVEKHILNTPYFHKQLYSDFISPQAREKYVGSAYLLLNSLPFKDLSDTIETTINEKKYGPALMSTLFREVGSNHYIPYHLMLKWGSIYHRYKKSINDSVDIIDGVTTSIDYGLFYSGTTWDGNYYNNVGNHNIGFHPFYEAVYHQIVNGYAHFNPLSGETYNEAVVTGITYIMSGQTNYGSYTYSSLVDETRFGFSGYTLLPTNGFNSTYGSDLDKSIQENFRVLWNIGVSDKSTVIDYSGYTFPGYTGYTKDVDTGDYSLSGNYRKVLDLIATFKPDILDVFERAFLTFASEKLNEEISYSPYDVMYSNFQDLLKGVSVVKKDNENPIVNDKVKLFNYVKSAQTTALQTVTNILLSSDNLVKIQLGNPREIDNYVLGGFTGVNVANFSVNPYDGYDAGDTNIELYLGEDMDGYYENFFSMMNIQVNETNVKQFRMIAYIYAGLRAAGINHAKPGFIKYLTDNLISPTFNDPNTGAVLTKDPISGISAADRRLYVYLKQLIDRFPELEIPTTANTTTKERGYNDDPIKLELYNYFKSFNDKWTSGNSIGQRTLMEEFLFLDKANKDIGDDLYIDMQRLTRLDAPENSKINLFSVISLLTQDSGIDIRALPSYVNFYGTNYTNTPKIYPSKDVAQTMFGSFLEVDYEDSSPKIILQYTGPTSKHPELSDINKKYKYKNDGFDIGDVNNNPIIVAPDVFRNTDYSKSNKVVAFEVSFGDQNQSIFKGVELDQATLRNTSESFEVLERLGRNETGSSTAQIDIGLFNIYRQSSYQCKVTAMGNMMIQPTMYFYVKNIPLFRGSYLITEVIHDIKANGAQTTFKGTRIPRESLPNPEDSFLASYRPLFDRLSQKAKQIVNEANKTIASGSGTTQTVVTSTGSYRTDPGNVEFMPGEHFLDKKVGITAYGIPYNGFNDNPKVQLIKYNKTPKESSNKEWLRAIAVEMGGRNYPIDPSKVMNVISNLTSSDGGTVRNITWRELQRWSKDTEFYSAPFIFDFFPPLLPVDADTVVNRFRTTEFLNPRLIEINHHRKGIVRSEHYADFIGNTFLGPVNIGPSVDGYGIGLSYYLMKELALEDGQVVYFRLI